MPELAWDELLHQEEAEELQTGCIVRKKLLSPRLSHLSECSNASRERGVGVQCFFAVLCNKRGSFSVVLGKGTCCSVWQHPRALQRDMYHIPDVEI